MSKSRTFSIYLIKEQYTVNNVLKEDHPLGEPSSATNLPPKSKLYLLDSPPYPPWWKEYWGVKEDIKQSLKGAIVFIPINDRLFALTFGHTYHYLKEYSYEYDFGLRMTLNSLDPKKLKSTDILFPEIAQRQRIQNPIASDITYFNFDRDSSIIKRLTGKVKDEYKDIFSNTTGASNLTVSLKKQPRDIPLFLSKLLDIYKKDDYKSNFPDIHNIIPIYDPLITENLNSKLMEAFEKKQKELVLSIPDIVDYNTNLSVYFSGAGRKQRKIYEDVYIDNYREYLTENSKAKMTIQELQKHVMNLCDDDGNFQKSYSVFKGLLFDCKTNDGHYHLCEGNWYQVDNVYLKNLQELLDQYFYNETLLFEYNHNSEEDYNVDFATKNKRFICLDKKNISLKGQTQIEPCDLYTVDNEMAIFYHIKLSTRSSTLSHLFNQGLNSAEILRTEQESKEKLEKLIKENRKPKDRIRYISPIKENKIRVVFAIITHKPNDDKSLNLPLFSKISLKRCINTFRLMNIDIGVCFVKDSSEKKHSRLKKRKTVKGNPHA